MPGETDLGTMLDTLEIERRPGTFAYASVHGGVPSDLRPAATVDEVEGTTIVALVEDLDAAGIPWQFACAWLTLRVHSSLAAVGLTAVLARRLADAGIPANVIAGAFHDHVLVPVGEVERARVALLGRSTVEPGDL